MNIFEKTKELNLPLGKYAVFGSGPLAAHGIRETRDIDIVVLPEVYEKLKEQGWQEKEFSDGSTYLTRDVFEVASCWNYEGYNPDVSWLIENAEIIKGVPFVKLEEVIKWKKSFGREKDKRDIKLIEEYLLRKKPRENQT